MPIKKKLTGKLRLWLHHFLNQLNPETFMNQTAASKAAGYQAKNDSVFAQIGYQNFKKLQDHIREWLEEYGLSDTVLKSKLISLLDAKETKFFQHEGEVVETRDVEALVIQKSALDMAFKVKGLYAPERHEHDYSGEIKHTHNLSEDLKSVLDAIYESKTSS